MSTQIFNPIADTMLRSSSYADTNYGTYPNISIGNTGINNQRSLLKFDLSSLAGVTLTAAPLLSLYRYQNNETTTRVFRVYRVIRSGWTELGATWNKYDGTHEWGTAGCGNTSTDREATDIGYTTISGTGTGWDTWTLSQADVQEWLDGEFANNGILIKADTEKDDVRNFYSRNYTDDITLRPKLTLEYFGGGGIIWM